MTGPRVLVLRAAGSNCDRELKFAFDRAGARADLVHVNRLAEGSERLDDYQILGIPGGFTYGDDIAAGRVLANELLTRIGDQVRDFLARDTLFTFGVRVLASEHEALLQTFEPVVAGARFAPAVD